MSSMKQPLVFVDIETTGGHPANSRVLEVGAIRVEEGRVVRTFQSLVNPATAVPASIAQLTGITTADISTAPQFASIAPELAEILEDAIFIAHNVHFDHGFLKMEFDRLGATFNPALLCTVRLSRALYPQYRRHNLQTIIERHGIITPDRHRALADADAIWQFYQIVHSEFDLDTIENVIKRQLKHPSLPSNLNAKITAKLPSGPGVYIFEDEHKQPLYVGKSINIRARVISHFADYHSSTVELKISQQIRHIRTIPTAGELSALLLESQLIKELQPLYNRQLRRRQTVIRAIRHLDDEGYWRLSLDNSVIDPNQTGDVMAVYATTGAARRSLHTTARNFLLCPKLMGLEKATGACFQYQLHKCHGACLGSESPADYNARFETAFEHQRLHSWPYPGPIVVTEANHANGHHGQLTINNWCLTDDQTQSFPAFDLDTYKIIRQFISNPSHRNQIQSQ